MVLPPCCQRLPSTPTATLRHSLTDLHEADLPASGPAPVPPNELEMGRLKSKASVVTQHGEQRADAVKLEGQPQKIDPYSRKAKKTGNVAACVSGHPNTTTFGQPSDHLGAATCPPPSGGAAASPTNRSPAMDCEPVDFEPGTANLAPPAAGGNSQPSIPSSAIQDWTNFGTQHDWAHDIPSSDYPTLAINSSDTQPFSHNRRASGPAQVQRQVQTEAQVQAEVHALEQVEAQLLAQVQAQALAEAQVHIQVQGQMQAMAEVQTQGFLQAKAQVEAQMHALSRAQAQAQVEMRLQAQIQAQGSAAPALSSWDTSSDVTRYAGGQGEEKANAVCKPPSNSSEAGGADNNPAI